MKKSVIILILLAFCSNLMTSSGADIVWAQPAVQTMALPAEALSVSSATNTVVLKGIRIFPDQPLKLDFIIDKGEALSSAENLKAEYTKLIKYFLTSLTVPEKDLWVNLSPQEPDRIIPDVLGQTEMGRDMLSQDYFLKQLTASLMYPEGEIGKKFWAKIYAIAAKKYGTTQIPVNTFHKVWIVPEVAEVYEGENVGFITKAKLKVMLEEEYLAQEKKEPQSKQQLSTEVIREVILPEIEREVNEGESFAALRQIYHALILAVWFKRNLKESFLGKSYVEKNKIAGIDLKDKQTKEKIYQQYLEAFKKGAYNFIKEELDPATQQVIPRKYFLGGEGFHEIGSIYRGHHRAEATDAGTAADVVTANMAAQTSAVSSTEE
ncbi:MAG: hypothetical protein NUV91_04225, partial [Candidatus Omnitrophica bacterium]|nr:hypothetical protein [Candidatus Omnitrophota bacterium]